MGRSEKQLDPHGGPLAQLAVDLRALRRKAGGPTYREMSRVAGYSPSALSAAASGANLPSAGVLTAYVRACGGDVEEWLRRRSEAVEVAVGVAVEVSEAAATVAAAETPRSADEPVSVAVSVPVSVAVPVAVSVPVPVAVPVVAEPEHPERRRLLRRHRFARRTAGLVAAAIVGSMATVVPMAVWGAPSCLTTEHSHSAPAHCTPTTAR